MNASTSKRQTSAPLVFELCSSGWRFTSRLQRVVSQKPFLGAFGSDGNLLGIRGTEGKEQRVIDKRVDNGRAVANYLIRDITLKLARSRLL
jgi:hypothetical protein